MHSIGEQLGRKQKKSRAKEKPAPKPAAGAQEGGGGYEAGEGGGPQDPPQVSPKMVAFMAVHNFRQLPRRQCAHFQLLDLNDDNVQAIIKRGVRIALPQAPPPRGPNNQSHSRRPYHRG